MTKRNMNEVFASKQSSPAGKPSFSIKEQYNIKYVKHKLKLFALLSILFACDAAVLARVKLLIFNKPFLFQFL